MATQYRTWEHRHGDGDDPWGCDVVVLDNGAVRTLAGAYPASAEMVRAVLAGHRAGRVRDGGRGKARDWSYEIVDECRVEGDVAYSIRSDTTIGALL